MLFYHLYRYLYLRLYQYIGAHLNSRYNDQSLVSWNKGRLTRSRRISVLGRVDLDLIGRSEIVVL